MIIVVSCLWQSCQRLNIVEQISDDNITNTIRSSYNNVFNRTR